MIGCPINYYIENMIFNVDKSCWAIFKSEGFDYDFRSNEGKKEVNYQLALFLAKVASEAQLIIIPKEQNIEDHYETFIEKLDIQDELYDKAVAVANQTKKYLQDIAKANDAVNDYDTYICVKLQLSADQMELVRESLAYLIKDPVNAFNTWMNLDTRDILESQVRRYREMAKDWLDGQMNSLLELQPVTTGETQWLLRRMGYRGLQSDASLWYEDTKGTKSWEPKAEEDNFEGEKVLKPYGKDIVNLFDGTIYPKSRYLEVHTEAGVSYQSFLVVNQLPETMENPGNEWIYMLQKNNIKAEVCIHFKAIAHTTAVKKVQDNTQSIQSQQQHIRTAHERVPSELFESEKQGEMLEAEIKASRGPLLLTTIQICIAADSLGKMKERVTRVRGLYKDRLFSIERPVADQLKLFWNFVPSVARVITDYEMPLSPMAAASGIFGVTHRLGDNKGSYVGYTGNEMKNVFLDLGEACLSNKSASGSLLGNLGVGKSFNLNVLIVLAVLYGGYGLIIDPKAERSHWKNALTLLSDHINIVTMSSNKENRGQLDPYVIYKDDLGAATELAINMIIELCKIPYGTPRYVTLKEAADQMQFKEIRCMNELVNILESWDEGDNYKKDAGELARLIRAEKNVGMGQLIYGYGDEQTISLENRLNIVQIAEMKLPAREKPKSDYTAEENMSAVVMLAIGQFAKRFAMQNQKRKNAEKNMKFQVIGMDESWMLGRTDQGQELYSFLVRMGRSLYTATLFNGHSVLDISQEEIRNGITYRFCFKTSDAAEARRMLEYLGLEESAENIRTINNLGNAQCMFRDANGRVGKLKFDAVFKDFIDVFSTTPKTTEVDQESILKKEVV